MKKIERLIKIITNVLAVSLGIISELVLHEMGHAIAVLITNNQILDISIKGDSYVNAYITHKEAIPIICISSFICTTIVCICLLCIKKKYYFFNTFRITLVVRMLMELIRNLIAVLFLTNKYECSDIGKFIIWTGYNRQIVAIITTIFIAFMVFVEVKVFLKNKKQNVGG